MILGGKASQDAGAEPFSLALDRKGVRPRPCGPRLSRATARLGIGAFLFLSFAGTDFVPAAMANGAFVALDDVPAVAPFDAASLLPAPTAPIPASSADEDQTGSEASPLVGPQPTAAGRSDRNESLRFGKVQVPRWLVETVVRASEDAGVDPAYMMALADKESSFSPEAKAETSSAEGLFQFLAGTWLEMVRAYGAKHGYAAAAESIQVSNGQLTIVDEVMRERVLGLRRDPYFSTLMAAELLKRDRAKVERRIGRDLKRSEFYLVHFLGAGSAGKLMEFVTRKPPQQTAPKLFPKAAKANKALFFSREGKKTRHLSVTEVYHRIDRMIDARLDRYVGVTDAYAAMKGSF